MTNEESFTDERKILGDLTNRPLKREFSKIAGDSGLNSGGGHGKTVVRKDEDSRLTKKVRMGVEILDKEECETTLSPPTESKVDLAQDNVVSIPSLNPDEAKEASNLVDDSIHSVKSGTVTLSVGEVGDASRDSCASTGSMPASSGMHMKESDDEEERLMSDVMLSKQVLEGFNRHDCNRDDENLGSSRLTSSELRPFELSWAPESRGSKSFELNRCTASQADACANLNTGADLLKHCSCSFCLKAAYIWSDLYYQDMKGRISALKKSQKEASILVNRYAIGKKTDPHTQGSSENSSKLESDLTGQWRSLFRHMEDIYADESNQLQASFAALKDLRENCKTDLQRIASMPPDKC